MLRRVCVVLLALLPLTAAAARACPVPPSAAREDVLPIAALRATDAAGLPLLLGRTVTVRGVVTVAGQFGGPCFVQDSSAGVAVYDSAFLASAAMGEEVTLTGTVTQYAGLTELTDVTVLARVPAALQPQAQPVTIAEIVADGERLEGRLLRLGGVTANTTVWVVSGSGATFRVTDGTDTLDLRIDAETDLANMPAPQHPFDVVGVLAQYRRNAPYLDGWQLMPRSRADVLGEGPVLLSLPREMHIEATRLRLGWSTWNPSTAFCLFGETPSFERGCVTGTRDDTVQSVDLDGLAPATLYWAQPFSVRGADTAFAPVMRVCSASAASTGELRVLFSRSVDTTVFPGAPARGEANLLQALTDRIDSARTSIDACLYSLGGTVGTAVAGALLRADARGLRVRVIAEADNAGTAPMQALAAALPLLTDRADATNGGAGLMHNKFFVFDARDRSRDDDDWVLTGSWNPTDPGTMADAQNVVLVQDQALATAYTAAFEQMWGGADDAPDTAMCRFGAHKTDILPHRFTVGGRTIEMWGSPGGRALHAVAQALRKSEVSAYFAIFTFTQNDLARVFLDRVRAGVSVRGVMDSDGEYGTQFAVLQRGGADVWLKRGLPGLLHHKYLVIDAERADRARVVTGSTNWSQSADGANDENLLIIDGRDVAAQFAQEWVRRYHEAGGTAMLTLPAIDAPCALRLAELDAWPTPLARGAALRLRLRPSPHGPLLLTVTDLSGRRLHARTVTALEAGTGMDVRTAGLPAGPLLIRVAGSGGAVTRRVVLR